MSNDGVLITDGELHFAMAVLRSLGKQAVPVTVAAERKDALAAYSRYCTKFMVYPSVKKNARLFVKSLLRYVKRNRFEVLFPLGDLTLMPISESRKDFEKHVNLPLPPDSSLKRTFDKSATIRLAEELDIPAPETFYAESTFQLKRLSEKISYPAVIKPRFSWFWRGNKTTTQFNIRPEYANSPNELFHKYLDMHERCPFPMVQEYIPGLNYSVAVLCNSSKVKASCSIKVHRTIPVMGGNSTFRESVEPNPQMMRYVYKLMEKLNWHGIAEVEFRVDARSQTPKLMEVNSRFWGSLQTAILAGVDFPYLLYRMVTEGDVKRVNHYKVGVKNRWLSGDIRHLISVLKGHYLADKFTKRSKWRTLLNFLKFYDNKYDCMCPNDMVPFFMSLKRWRMCYKSYKLKNG